MSSIDELRVELADAHERNQLLSDQLLAEQVRCEAVLREARQAIRSAHVSQRAARVEHLPPVECSDCPLNA